MLPCNTHTPPCSCRWVPCAKRIAGHQRGLCCNSKHSLVKCVTATCSKVAHIGCMLQLLNDKFTVASSTTTWTCLTCAAVPVEQPIEVVKPEEIRTTCHRAFMAKDELLRLLKASSWRCRSSTAEYMYFNCTSDTCNVVFSAQNKNPTDKDAGEWVIKQMPLSHECCKGDTKTPSALLSSQAALPQHVFKEIQRLACGQAFNSASIQRHIQIHEKHMVDTQLIFNIGYRARHKLFGSTGDLSHLYEQQKVTALCFCHTS